jgi:hypothetical protein
LLGGVAELDPTTSLPATLRSLAGFVRATVELNAAVELKAMLELKVAAPLTVRVLRREFP